MVLQSNTSRDSDIFNAIEKVFASDALKYGSVVEALAKAFRSDTQNYDTVVIDLYQSLSQDDGVAVDLDAWFGNWKYIKEKVIRLERFASRLSESHKDRDYQPVIDFITETAFPPPPSTTVTMEDIDQKIADLVAPFNENMMELAMGRRGFPTWVPTTNNEHKKFLTDLGIPSDTRMKPDLLLFELGQLAREDPVLRKRVKNLFGPGILSHRFLVNTSGAGKTRLLMEGLCRYWGIYVTAKPDTFSHGSEDAGTVIDDTIRQTMGFESSLSKLPPVDLAKQLPDNVDIAQRHFKCLLLARLHVLRMFLEIVDSLPGAESDDTYRKRWLELQIRPSLLGGGKSDIFRYLTKALIRETSQPKLEISELDQLIQDRLDYITPRCTPEKKSTTAYIYIVADEVQHALTQLPDAFRSSDGKLCRSVFREMIQSWAAFTGVIIVAAGTGVDSEVLEDSMHSAVQKYSKYERFFDTGSFSIEAKTMQEAYMKRFIPSDVVNHDVFKGLISRTTYWLKGRFRFTAGFISELLAAEFERPHEVLNQYIFQLTSPPARQKRTVDLPNPISSGINVTDGERFIPPATGDEEMEKIPAVSKRTTFDFSKLAEPEHLNKLSSIINMVVRFWLSADGRIENLSATEFDFVQWGFARFIPGTAKENAEIGRFDEPMALLALAQWLNVAGFAETIHHRLSGEIGDHNASGENALEDYLAFCFAGLFSDTSGTRRLEDIFTFAKETPAWAKQTATLVSLYRNPDTGLMEESVVDWASRPSYSLGTRSSSKPKQDSATTPQSKVDTEDMKAAQVTLKWLEHAERTPICFPSTLMGPDLLFILRLEDGKKIWVAVQSKYESTDLLTASKLKKAIRSLTPGNYFSSTKYRADALKRLKALPDREVGVGELSLLRVVVSHPGETALQLGSNRREMTTLPNMKHYDDEHPLASLNMDYLGSITKNMAPLNYVSDTIRKAKVKAAEAAAAAEATNAAAAAEAEETSTKRRNEDQVEGEESRSAKKPRVVAAASPSRTPVSPSRGTYHSRLHSRHINSRGPSVDSLDVDMGGDYEGAPPNSAAGTDEEMTDSDLLGSGYDRLFYAQF